MRFKKILGAIRTTEGLSPVFDAAVALAKNQGASLMLYHCMEFETLANLEDRIATVSALDASGAEKTHTEWIKRTLGLHQALLESMCVRAGEEGVGGVSSNWRETGERI